MKKREPKWLTVRDAIGFHGLGLAQAGGSEGVRAADLLESAVHRPRQLWHYESPDLYDLAAAYAFAIANNHPFVDGNKRAAFIAAFTFLVDNGVEPPADPAQATVMTAGLADKTISEAQYAAWLRARASR
ncbi:MAG: type II toxin-antitoxin system death-on-curing family toxin [Tepidisphaerales bacterium]